MGWRGSGSDPDPPLWAAASILSGPPAPSLRGGEGGRDALCACSGAQLWCFFCIWALSGVVVLCCSGGGRDHAHPPQVYFAGGPNLGKHNFSGNLAGQWVGGFSPRKEPRATFSLADIPVGGWKVRCGSLLLADAEQPSQPPPPPQMTRERAVDVKGQTLQGDKVF